MQEPRLRRRQLVVVVAAFGGGVLVLDQVSKALALARLTPGEPVDLIGSLIRLNLVRNAGAAFSLGDRATWVLTLVALGVLVAILGLVRRLGSMTWAIALGLLLGGAVGNLLDRFFREPGVGRGQVVDFIDYFGLFVGNVADVAIVAAAVWIGILSMRGIPATGERVGRHVEPARRHTEGETAPPALGEGQPAAPAESGRPGEPT